MLAWSPPPGARYCEPLTSVQSLVRFLGGLSTTSTSGEDPSVGDVVYRVANGSLVMRWSLVFSRLDPFVRNGVQPVIVLDNVPWAFAASTQSRSPIGYGNNMGPLNVSEYRGFVQQLLEGVVARYGLEVAQTFWFRVGTEPDTQPAHWNDTNCKFVEMYTAVAGVVAQVVPGARVGPANFAADGSSRAESWAQVVVPIVRGIAANGARVDFLAMSSYGRATMCAEGHGQWQGGEGWDGPGAATSSRVPDHPPHLAWPPHLVWPRMERGVERRCEYSVQSSAEAAERLASLLSLLPGSAARGLPLQAMEYGRGTDMCMCIAIGMTISIAIRRAIRRAIQT